jgi:arylsulfatase A-like enzyme
MADKLTRKEFIKLAAQGSLALPLAVSSICCRRQPVRPNVIFILTDDQACRAVGCYDDRLIKTPHIDRLAEEGVRFELSFSTNAICAPSRASILTGQYSHRHGVVDNSIEMSSQANSFALLFKGADYQTALIGKWHLKAAPLGFDHYCILPDQGQYYNPDFIEKGRKYREYGYVTDLLTEKSLAWLKDRDKQKPFLLFLNHKAPHRNWMPALEFLDLYRHEDLPVPETYFDDYATRCAAARLQEMTIANHAYLAYDLKLFPLGTSDLTEQEKVGLDYWLSAYNRLTAEQKEAWDKAYREDNEEFRRKKPEGQELAVWKYQRYIKDYLRCLASVDIGMRRLLEFLDEEGLADNTVVVFTSDQGFFLGEHGWFDKRFMYEPSLRTPLILRFPDGIERKRVDKEHMVLNVDLAPTLLDLAGIPVPAFMQGRSFKGLLQGKKIPDWRRSFYYHYYEYPAVHSVRKHYGVRTRRHKLIHYYDDIDCWELFDLERDPEELHNVYGSPDYAGVKGSLQKELGRLRAELGAE